MPKKMVFDPETTQAIHRAQKAVGDRYTKGLIDFFGAPADPRPQEPTAFQEQAADRATRLFRQAGPNMNMELDPQYRENLLGRNVTPASAYTSLVRGPMQKLNKAVGISEKASKRRVTIDNIKKGQ